MDLLYQGVLCEALHNLPSFPHHRHHTHTHTHNTYAGAGEPNFDSLVANPYASLKERREQEVAHLLDKLQPDTIVLDPDTIGRWVGGWVWCSCLGSTRACCCVRVCFGGRGCVAHVVV